MMHRFNKVKVKYYYLFSFITTDFNCSPPPNKPKDVDEFKKTCEDAEKRHRCCILPLVAGIDLLCTEGSKKN